MLLAVRILPAQPPRTERPFARADSLALVIPAGAASSTTALAQWIGSQAKNETEKARILFTWIATNITYDVQQKFSPINFYGDTQIAARALASRLGLCIHYAVLFCEVAEHMGLQAYTVAGQTRRETELAPAGHAWVAVRIDGQWYLMDPTWAAGGVEGLRFKKKFDDKWFMVPPDRMVRTHLPFDPQWQLQQRPVSLTAFATGKEVATSDEVRFAYDDSIRQYLNMADWHRTLTTVRRIQRAKAAESPDLPATARKARDEEYERHLLPILYNRAVDDYNDAVRQMNRYVEHKNRQFSPERPEAEVRGYLYAA
ncbi:MAG TPA: transglutaminase domain-containing protein, partial [Phnomibacter sp.]|nr:transglutaminase domain-containing protein [Phnomibacter sp.]